jgi:hypothetical protein
VDKIINTSNSYGYSATYSYDNNNKLIQIYGTSYYDTKFELVFEYESNRVFKITHYDFTYFFNYCVEFIYNTKNQLIREETRLLDGHLIDWIEFYYKNEKVDSIYCFDGYYIVGDPDRIFWHSIVPFYDEAHNVVKAIVTGPKIDMLGIPHPYETVSSEKFYEYDDQLQPNIGIKYFFPFHPFFGYSDNSIVCLLSVNNITKTIQNNKEIIWNYTYNEYGLPKTYQENMGSIFKITYKEITTGIPEPPDIAEVQVYPNPTTGELRVTSYELQVTSIEVFDVFGRKHEWAKGRMGEWANGVVMDISDLLAGIYFVKVVTEAGEVVKKVIKN